MPSCLPLLSRQAVRTCVWPCARQQQQQPRAPAATVARGGGPTQGSRAGQHRAQASGAAGAGAGVSTPMWQAGARARGAARHGRRLLHTKLLQAGACMCVSRALACLLRGELRARQLASAAAAAAQRTHSCCPCPQAHGMQHGPATPRTAQHQRSHARAPWWLLGCCCCCCAAAPASTASATHSMAVRPIGVISGALLAAGLSLRPRLTLESQIADRGADAAHGTFCTAGVAS
jgi:hypothetical protein